MIQAHPSLRTKSVVSWAAPRVLAASIVALCLLPACASLSAKARAEFMAGGGCNVDVTTTEVADGYFVVTGCGQERLFACQHPSRGYSYAEQRVEGQVEYEHRDLSEAKCERVNRLCLAPGCDSPEVQARQAFHHDRPCPMEQVSVAPGPPPQPPAWTFIVARGCGATVTYSCKGGQFYAAEEVPAPLKFTTVCTPVAASANPPP
jgi:hypothetical protein